MLEHPPDHGIYYRAGTDHAEHSFGVLKVHTFNDTLGAERINVAEHSIFLIESDVETTDVWEGLAERPRQWLAADIVFLPAGTEVCTRHVSNAYNETMVRIPDHALRDVAKGEISIDDLSLHFHAMPRKNVFGITQAVRNLAIAQADHGGFAMLVESMTQSLSIGVLYGLLADRNRLTRSPNGLTPERKRRVIEFVEANLSRSISLADIAGVAALSPYHFTRAFRREMGTTPLRYVWHRRSRLAKQLLGDVRMTLVSVALACGFSNQSHFTTAFKADTGLTPGAYRKGLI